MGKWLLRGCLLLLLLLLLDALQLLEELFGSLDGRLLGLARLCREMPARGLAIQVSVRNVEEARKVQSEFRKYESH